MPPPDWASFLPVPDLLSKNTLSSCKGRLPLSCSEAVSGEALTGSALTSRNRFPWTPVFLIHSPSAAAFPAICFPLWPLHFAVDILGRKSKGPRHRKSSIKSLGSPRKSLFAVSPERREGQGAPTQRKNALGPFRMMLFILSSRVLFPWVPEPLPKIHEEQDHLPQHHEQSGSPLTIGRWLAA